MILGALLLMPNVGWTRSPDTVTASDVRVGHWIEVRGTYSAGVFLAERAELSPPAEFELLLGPVSESVIPGDRFRVLDQEVHASERTDWAGDPALQAGQLVKVEGRYRGPRKFSARDIRPRKGGRARLAGRVDDVRTTSDGIELVVMRYRVLLPHDLAVETTAALDELPLLAPRYVPTDPSLKIDEDDLFGAGIALGHDLTFTGQLEAKVELEDEFDLTAADDEDRTDTTGSLRGRLRWDPAGDWSALVTFRETLRYRDDDEDGADTTSNFRLAETLVAWAPADSNWDLAFGRQDFDDQREWVYDQNLDGVRVGWGRDDLRVDLSLTTTLSNGSPLDEETTNTIAYVSSTDRDRHLAGYVVHRDNGGFSPDTATHLGVRALGEWLHDDIESWLELAHLRGERGGADVEAWGIDLGATFEPEFAEPWRFTAGWALGSGDGSPGGTDRGFRQTGLQDNNANFGGVTSFRYYGELIDPELANLGVLTLGAGVALAERTSLDLVWHSYWQDHALGQLADSALDRRPTGLDPDIGQELDLILGSRELESWDLELVGGWFRPGAAFNDDENAYVAKIQLRYRF